MTLEGHILKLCFIEVQIMNDTEEKKQAFELRKMYALDLTSPLPVVIMLLLVASCFLFSAKEQSVHDKILRHRHIASFMSTTNLTHRLAMRARPNARIAVAFGIENSFTTANSGVHHRFLQRAVSIIKSVDQAAWMKVRDTAEHTLALMNLGQREAKVEPMVRILCFNVVLRLMTPAHEQLTVDIQEADWITDTINWLWIESKAQGKQDNIRQEAILLELRSRLKASTLDYDGDPLALIIPAYETLWRVVLLTYVHVAFRQVDEETQPIIQAALDSVLKDEEVQFDAKTTKFAAVSTELLSAEESHAKRVLLYQEALRLYPPTKRLYRASDDRSEAADIESLHHDARIWGPDALEFRPGRFAELTKDQRDAYIPFGAGRHTCPAANGFAGNMIVLLVAVLLKSVGSVKIGAHIVFEDEILDKDETACLPTGRSASRNWVVYPAA